MAEDRCKLVVERGEFLVAGFWLMVLRLFDENRQNREEGNHGKDDPTDVVDEVRRLDEHKCRGGDETDDGEA